LEEKGLSELPRFSFTGTGRVGREGTVGTAPFQLYRNRRWRSAVV